MLPEKFFHQQSKWVYFRSGYTIVFNAVFPYGGVMNNRVRRSLTMGFSVGLIAMVLTGAASAADSDFIAPVRDYFPNGVPLSKIRTNASSSTYNFNAYARLLNGSAENRVNIAIAGDGFAVNDTSRFPGYADSNMAYRRGLSSIRNNKMCMRPYPRYDKFFNWYYINLVSPESGVSGPGNTVNNALGAERDNDRLGWVDDRRANAMFSQVESRLGIKIHWHEVVINIDGYYNSGGPIVVFAFPNWGDIACHEAGHGFHHFADEYYGSGSDSREYDEVNSTAKVGSEKWQHWVGYKDVDPRTRSGGGSPTGDTVGFYLGSRYVSSGQYRPTSNSKMNMTGQSSPTSFNAPCREKIIHDIYSIVKPVDTMLANTGTVNSPDSVWVQVIDPNVLKVDWYVDDVLKKPDGGTSISRSEISSVPGTFKVKAHVYDEVIRHMYSDNKNPDTLDLVRKDTTKLVQDVEWTVNISNVDVFRTTLEKDVFSLSMQKNTVVYSLNRPGEVTFELFGLDGSLVNRMRVHAVAGRNSLGILNGSTGVPAGMYFLRMRTGEISKTVPVSVQQSK